MRIVTEVATEDDLDLDPASTATRTFVISSRVSACFHFRSDVQLQDHVRLRMYVYIYIYIYIYRQLRLHATVAATAELLSPTVMILPEYARVTGVTWSRVRAVRCQCWPTDWTHARHNSMTERRSLTNGLPVCSSRSTIASSKSTVNDVAHPLSLIFCGQVEATGFTRLERIACIRAELDDNIDLKDDLLVQWIARIDHISTTSHGCICRQLALYHCCSQSGAVFSSRRRR